MREEIYDILKDIKTGALHWSKVPHFLTRLLAWFLDDSVVYLDLKIGWKQSEGK